MNTLLGLIIVILFTILELTGDDPAPPPDIDAPRPIDRVSALELERLTWMEIRDLMKQGAKRVIVPTGGIEQSGPYVALGKHDLIVKAVAVRIAARLGNTLVAPTISFVPEGNIAPASGHMLYPGTLSVTQDTFVSLLRDIGSSLITHGFEEIIILGDSGDSQEGMRKAAERLTRERGSEARVHFVGAFYDYDLIRRTLKERGFALVPESFHEELPFTLQLLAIDPGSARYEERKRAGRLSLNGASLADFESMAALGRELLEMRAERTAAVIRNLPR